MIGPRLHNEWEVQQSRASPGLWPGEPSWPPSILSPGPPGDTVSKQTGVRQAKKMLVTAPLERTGLLENASVRLMTEMSW